MSQTANAAPAQGVNAPATQNVDNVANGTMSTTDQQVHRSAALYVGDLHPLVNEADLFDIFNAVASVASVRVCRHAITRQSLGYAYVNFHTIVDAEKVLDTMNYTQIKGRMSRLMWSQRDPSFRRSGNGNIFIKNLDSKIDSKDLNDIFSTYGNIISCKVVTDRETGASRGYGFVQFETEGAALEAIKTKHETELKNWPGEKVYVSKFESADRRHKKQQWTNLFVKNIPASWGDSKLDELFSKHGTISSITIVSREVEGEDADASHKGYGFVDFVEHESAKSAQEALNGQVVEGEFKTLKDSEEKVPLKLYVGRFQKKRERSRLLQERRQQAKATRIKEFLGKNLYVRNLHEECTDEALRKEFAAHGSITSAKVMKNENDQSRGFGFVCFATQNEASKAHKALQGYLFMNKPLYIAMWQPREERQQFLRRQHEVRMPNGGRGGMHAGPGGLMPMMSPPGYPMPMFANPLQQYPRPGMYGRPGGPGLMGPGGRGAGFHGYPPQQGGYGGRGNMMGRGGGRGRGRGRGAGNNTNNNNRGDGGNMQQMPVPNMQVVEQQPHQQQQQQQQQMAQQQVAPAQVASAPLNTSTLAAASPLEKKNMIGEKLYPLVQTELMNRNQPTAQAGKITGMLLDGVEIVDLLNMLETPSELESKVSEALRVLQESSAE